MGARVRHTGRVTLTCHFLDANPALRTIAERLQAAGDAPGLRLAFGAPGPDPQTFPARLAGAEVAVIDHSALPLEVARRCTGLERVVFLGTGVRSYMDPEALGTLGIGVDTIRGYGDTAVAEHALALAFAGARGLASMDRAMRAGQWQRTEGLQLGGKTLGLVGFGGIARELARLALGIGMQVIAWNRSPQAMAGVRFVDPDTLLARSDVLSLHLLLVDETRGWLSRERLDRMKPGAILVNTARGALVDEDAMAERLADGRLAHAALDVFAAEPLPPGHRLATLGNVTLSAHSAFRTAEANENLVRAALAHCRAHASRRAVPGVSR